jgi:site-specific DNA recombinase
MRAAIYVRISRDRIGAGLGVERQEADCRELAERMGYAVVAVYIDNDLSAYSGKPRPAYRRMLDAVAAGLIDVVLAWHTDRLHRRPTELEEYIAASDTHGVPTHTVKAGALDLATPSGKLVARQLGAVARYEVDHAIERQQRARLQAATAGRWGGGRRPYGYQADGVTPKPDEAAVIAEATDAVLSGSSLRSVALDLNARGARTSTGRQWKATEVRKVLLRARNAGLREHQGEVIGLAEWPAVVAEDRWRAVVSLLSDPQRRTVQSTTRRWLLSNLATCGVCGSLLRVTMLATTRASVPSYSCSEGKCVVRNAVEVETMVSGVIVARLRRPDAVELLRPASPAVDVGALRDEAMNLRGRLDDLADDLDLDERTLARRGQALRARIEEIEQRLAATGRGSVLAGVVDAPDVQAAWDALHLDRRRAVIDAVAEVIVHRTRKGRPPGWKPGQSYFDPRSVEIRPRATA